MKHRERFSHKEAEEIGNARHALWRAAGGNGLMIDYLKWIGNKWALFQLEEGRNFTSFLITTTAMEAKL